MNPGQKRQRVAERDEVVAWEDAVPDAGAETWWPEADLSDILAGDCPRVVDLEAGDAGPEWDFADPIGEEVPIDPEPPHEFAEPPGPPATADGRRTGRLRVVAVAHALTPADPVVAEPLPPREAERASPETGPPEPVQRAPGQLVLLSFETADDLQQKPERSRRGLRLQPMPSTTQIELLFRTEGVRV